MTARPAPVAVRLAVGLLAPALLLVAGCSGDEEPADDRTPGEVLAEAKKQLDETSGVSLELSTEELPDGVDGVLQATGIATRAPAFDGDLKVLFNNLTFDVPVVSVDGTVHAQIPGSTEMAEITPADYGAPDPANLMNPDGGISSWLTAAEGVEEGEQQREGRLVVTEYTATLPGKAVSGVIPSADESAEFEATFTITDEDRLDSARIVGPFYGDQGDVDYTIRVEEYDVDKDITAP
jgi:lipoprotein LprG